MSTPNRIQQLREALGKATDRVLILPHNDPDPDAIAASVALHYLLSAKWGIQSLIVYDGIIGRAENRVMVRFLGRPLRKLQASHLRKAEAILLVDTQPGFGNNSLPPDVDATAVFDHHPGLDEPPRARYVDVRRGTGAVSTMLTEYLQAADLELPPTLATALFYGIKTDTMSLGRGAGPADIQAYFFLQPLIDVEMLAEIENAQVSAEYFVRLAATLKAARIYENLLMSIIPSMNRPDLAAEMADLLLRLQGIQWVVCLGPYKTHLHIAIRTRNRRGGAHRLVKAMVGAQGSAGGHGSMAGGQVPLEGHDPLKLAHRLARKARQHLNVTPGTRGQRLI